MDEIVKPPAGGSVEAIRRLIDELQDLPWSVEVGGWFAAAATELSALLARGEALEKENASKQQECDELYAEISAKVSARDATIAALRARLAKRDEERDRLKALLRGAADRINAVEFPLFLREAIDAARTSVPTGETTDA